MDFDNQPHDSPSRAEIYGLATLAGHAGTRRDLRVKAIRALARIPDQNAIHVLAEMALWEEDEELRLEAYHALETTFGDDLPEVLEGIRRELTGDWGETRPDGEGDAEEEEVQSSGGWNRVPREGTYQPDPVTSEVGAPLWLLWVVVGIVVIGGIVILMWMR